MAAHLDRIDRQAKLETLIPAHGDPESCPDVSRLLEKLGSLYGDDATPSARRRAVQRDLGELLDGGRIEAVNPGGKPLRYRRVKHGSAPEDDPYTRKYLRETVRNIVETEFPAGHLDAVWKALLESDTDVGLGPDKLRIVSDTQRLRPAEIRPAVLADALEALALSKTLKATYRDRADKTTSPTLHPQAFVQRGPRAYLYALKDDETDPVRMYALHRFLKTAVGDKPARRAPDFDLQATINSGQADFADGELIELELRARRYVAELLRDCPLNGTQRMEDEPEGSDFDMRVSAAVPATGQLLRWLLGCGDNLEVVAPERLRNVVATQAAKVAALYGLPAGGSAA